MNRGGNFYAFDVLRELNISYDTTYFVSVVLWGYERDALDV